MILCLAGALITELAECNYRDVYMWIGMLDMFSISVAVKLGTFTPPPGRYTFSVMYKFAPGLV